MEYDQCMIKTYLRYKKLDKVDVGFCFQPGDQVMKLDRPKSKVLPKCSGPYQFEKYLGRRGLTAGISTTSSNKLQLSSTHLCPMLSQFSPRMLRWPEHAKEPGFPPSRAS